MVSLCTCSESSSSLALSTGSRWVCGRTAVRVDLISGLMGGLLTWAFHSGDRRRRWLSFRKKIDKLRRKRGNKEDNRALIKSLPWAKRKTPKPMQLNNSYKKSLIFVEFWNVSQYTPPPPPFRRKIKGVDLRVAFGFCILESRVTEIVKVYF